MSKTLKKTLSIIIAILMIATTMPFTFAAETVDTGTCGASTNDGGAESVKWTLDSDGVLTISGTGAMTDYTYDLQSPFFYNSDIITVVIKDGVTSIGDSAFWYCTNLESIEIPNSVTSIGNSAFRVCTSLTSITIPDSVTSIGTSVFEYCEKLENITVDEGNKTYSSDENGVLFNKDKTTLILYPVGKSETSYTVPDGVTSIGNFAFVMCTSLESVTIGNSVTSIGDAAFGMCTSLTSVTIGNSVTNIGNQTFYGCSSLASITIPDCVTSIGNQTFYGCTSLASITIPDSVTNMGYSVFVGCTSLASVTIGNGVTSIGNSAFSYCESLESIEIPDGVTSIGDWAFYNCTSLESITISDSVTSIGDYAFGNCTSLTLVHYLGTSEQWDKIEIGSDCNDELTGATRHYCTETESVDATCTEAGYTAGWYCADCEEYVVGHEETAALGHVDTDGDYICDYGCGHEFEKPATDNVCEDCGKVHTNFFSEIICFFTRIINFIKNLFA